MTKKKDEEKDSKPESWEAEDKESEAEVTEDVTPLILTDVEKFIIDTLTRLEGKFNKTFNNHTLIHGRFRRGRKTINR